MRGGNAANGVTSSGEKDPGKQDIVLGKTTSSEQINGDHRLLQQLARTETFYTLKNLSRMTNAVKNYNLMQP